MYRFILLLALVAASTQTLAVQVKYTGLTHPSLIGKSSLDGFWNNGNDVDVSAFGLNPSGSASSFLNSPTGDFGFFPTLERLIDNDLIGSYVDLSITGTAELTLSDLSVTNILLSNALSATGVNSGTFNPVTQVFAGDYDTLAKNQGQPSGVVRSHSTGIFLANGQIPANFISDTVLLNHVNFLIPLLPANWQIMSVWRDDYTILDPVTLVSNGETGSASFVAFSAVPIPAALPLFGVALGGIFGLARTKRKVA